MTDWKNYLQNLHDEPERFDAEMEDLRAQITKKPWEAELYFLYAKVCENYPFNKSTHYEQFDKAVIGWANENYDRAISLRSLPEYIAERDKFRKSSDYSLIEKSREFAAQPRKEAMYYKSSGKFSPVAFVYAGFAAVTAIPLVSFLYALTNIEVPYFVIKFILPVLFGVLVGAAINFALIVFGKTRNGWVALLLASALSIWAYFLHWVFFFVYADTKQHLPFNFHSLLSSEGDSFIQQTLFLVKHPLLVFDLIQKYVPIGIWTFLGINFSGGLLVFTLILEFIILFVSAIWLGTLNYHKPFDELENRWFKEKIFKINKYFTTDDRLVEKLEAQDYRGILTPRAQKNTGWTTDGYSEFFIYENSRQNYLTVNNMTPQVVKKKITYTQDSLVEFIQITPQFAAEIKAKDPNFSPPQFVPELNNMNYYDSMKDVTNSEN